MKTQDILYHRHALAKAAKLLFNLFAVATKGSAGMMQGLKLKHI